MKQAKTKKNLKNKNQKKNSFTSNSNLTATSFFILKNCSCKSNLKYLIQLDNKFDSSFRVIRTLLIRYSTSTKTIRRRTISFQEKLQKNGSLRSFKKLWNISIFNFIFTEFNSHANKNPSYTSFLYFFHFNVKSTSYKSKNKSYIFANS